MVSQRQPRARAQPVDPPPPAPGPNQQPDRTQFGALANTRGAFVKELDNNPDLRRKLMASLYAEVGMQSPKIQQGYLELVMNRAVARKQSLYDTISDPNYYPTGTIDQLGRQATPEEQNQWNPLIENILRGSNVSGFATGNQSGKVASGGAPITVPRENRKGDDLIIEKATADTKWADNMAKQQAYVKAHGQPTTPDAPNVNVLKDVPVPRAQPAVPSCSASKPNRGS